MGKKILIYGRGISGKGAAKLLEQKKYNIDFIDDHNSINIDLSNYEFVVKSPGIRNDTPFMKKNLKEKIEIFDEIDITLKYLNKNTKMIAVTGTNGKTTVTTQLTKLLKLSNFKAECAGNIGKSFAELISEKNDFDFIILELSSFQLEYIKKLKPFIAIVLNLSEDHLDRYKDKWEYFSTKLNVFKNQDTNDWAIVSNCDFVNKNSVEIKSKIIKIDTNSEFDLKNSSLIFNDNKKDIKIDVENILKTGTHNIINFMFIWEVARILNIDIEIVKKLMKDFSPLEHRMENVFKYKNTLFINDSKSTNIDSTIKALESFEKYNVFLICGGFDKKLDYYLLIDKIEKSVKKVYLIGELGKILVLKLKKDFTYSKTLAKSLLLIKEEVDFEKKNIVLLSPATSSYDQFENFKERGKKFKEIVFRSF